MKIGFISFPIPGHFNPMSALARQLQSRNHDVVIFSLPVGESFARAADLPFVPFAEKEHPRDKSGEILGTFNNAPQLELLKKASVCITHAGFNTVLEALTQGVPQIAIPVTNDQPGVAARVAHKKTGKTTSLDGLDASNLSALLDEVVNNPVYRDNSRSIQKAIAKKNGLSVAADLLEQTFGLTKKTEASVQKVV
jgi:UDP:flavonoid glycosyltransferase YjiC (YdhE family)